MPIIGIKCTDEEKQIIYKKYGSPSKMLAVLLEKDISGFETINSKLDDILSRISCPDNKFKKTRNKDFSMSEEEFRENTKKEFSKYSPNQEKIIIHSNKFCDYWLELSKSGIPRYQMEKTWQLSKRVARWVNDLKNGKNQSYSEKVSGKNESQRIQTEGRSMDWSNK